MSPWIIYALIGAIAAGATNVLIKAGMRGVDSNLATALRTVLILPVVWAWAIWINKFSTFEKFSAAIGKITRQNWSFLALSAIFAGISWIASYKAIDLAGAAKPAPIDKASLAFAVLLAYLFLGEKISPKTLVATILVLAGLVVAALPGKTFENW